MSGTSSDATNQNSNSGAASTNNNNQDDDDDDDDNDNNDNDDDDEYEATGDASDNAKYYSAGNNGAGSSSGAEMDGFSNRCVLIWQGVVPKRSFTGFKFQVMLAIWFY